MTQHTRMHEAMNRGPAQPDAERCRVCRDPVLSGDTCPAHTFCVCRDNQAGHKDFTGPCMGMVSAKLDSANCRCSTFTRWHECDDTCPKEGSRHRLFVENQRLQRERFAAPQPDAEADDYETPEGQRIGAMLDDVSQGITALQRENADLRARLTAAEGRLTALCDELESEDEEAGERYCELCGKYVVHEEGCLVREARAVLEGKS